MSKTVVEGYLSIEGYGTSDGESVSCVELTKGNPFDNILIDALDKYDGKNIRITVEEI